MIERVNDNSADSEIDPAQRLAELTQQVVDHFDRLNEEEVSNSLKVIELPDNGGVVRRLQHQYIGGNVSSDEWNRHIDTYTVAPDGAVSATFYTENNKDMITTTEAPDDIDEKLKLFGQMLGILNNIERNHNAGVHLEAKGRHGLGQRALSLVRTFWDAR